MPIDFLALQPLNRALPPLLRDGDFQLGVPHHDPGQGQPGQVVPGLRRNLLSYRIPQRRNRRLERPRIGKFLLHLFVGQRIAVVHQLFVARAMDPVEPGVQGVMRLVVLVASYAPVAHGCW